MLIQVQSGALFHKSTYHWGLLYAIALVTLIQIFLGFRQNTAEVVGGPISVPKLLWLNYTIIAWFVVPWFLWRYPQVALPLRQIFAIHLLSMGLRGAIELWLCYRTITWHPFYGITHDLFQLGLLTSLQGLLHIRTASAVDAFNRHVDWFVCIVQLSLIVEVVFALLYYRTGLYQQAIYFIPPTPPHRFNNTLTVIVEMLLYTQLVAFLWSQHSTLFHWLPSP